MATKQTTAATVKLVTEPVVEQSIVEVPTPMTAEQIAQAKAQVKQLQAALKADKANQPKRNSLQAEIDKQETSPNQSLRWLMWSMVRNRTQHGQSFAEAREAVLVICANLIDAGHGKDTWNEAKNQ
jgi:hypothetical protein